MGKMSWKYASDGGLYYSIKYILLNRDTEKKMTQDFDGFDRKKSNRACSYVVTKEYPQEKIMNK